ncbi:MAG: aconitate hydratase AcnA [Proteobacteria bacterium]|nr:aconitate hydratase AcnA [Burkholderiales bacterium]
MPHTLPDTLGEFTTAAGKTGKFHSLPALEKAGVGPVSRLPISLRIVLESALRNFDGKKITEAHVKDLANWQPKAVRTAEVPFVVARILLQDMTGVPLVVDLAAMREAVKKLGKNPDLIEPLVPAHLIMDHSVQIDHFGTPDALEKNMAIEFTRNAERYQFLKWSAQAFKTFQIIPPGNGIVHQVNLEYISRVVWENNGMYYPDSTVGTDSHTTMVNGLGVLAWGVGGIEAEAGMLGQPLYFLTPDVVGVNLTGKLKEGVTATDLVLALTQMLRAKKVVGKFVEFFGDGAASLPLPDRATIGNMAPEYGATCGFFPVDDTTIAFLRTTGREDAADVAKAYYEAQGMYGMPKAGAIDYSETCAFDLSTVKPAVSGPRRPHDRLDLPDIKATMRDLMGKPVVDGGYGKTGDMYTTRFPTTADQIDIGNGDVLIAAITSCTNTSNPGVLLAAGLLAKKAVEKGLKPNARVKTSLAPGSKSVTQYLTNSGLLTYLEQLGFFVAGYGCTTCIGNSGPLDPAIDEAIVKNDVVAAAVLSGNRNFEARIHQNIRANFLASPPLVVAFALAGTTDIDLTKDAIGTGRDGKPVYLKDIWPSTAEIGEVMKFATDTAMYKSLFSSFTAGNPMWDAVPTSLGSVYAWDSKSTYVQHPPYFDGFTMHPNKAAEVRGAKVLGIFGDSITTDHISPAGGIRPSAPAGRYLQGNDVTIADFNTYGSRRGNHEVMMRGTFANVRIKNLMLPGTEGGITTHQPSGEQMPIYEAAMKYKAEGTPSVVFGGEEYGQGSSRDWAAKGPQLLGVKAVIVKSFERIHRANLVFMGVLPLQFKEGTTAVSLKLDGSETIDITGLEAGIKPQMEVTMTVRRKDGSSQTVPLLLRIDTPIEVDYYLHGGILPYVLRELMAKAA